MPFGPNIPLPGGGFRRVWTPRGGDGPISRVLWTLLAILLAIPIAIVMAAFVLVLIAIAIAGVLVRKIRQLFVSSGGDSGAPGGPPDAGRENVRVVRRGPAFNEGPFPGGQ